MKMTENFKILAEFVKDISSETADIQTYIFVKEQISKYHLNIDINSKALKLFQHEDLKLLKYVLLQLAYSCCIFLWICLDVVLEVMH